MTPRETFAHDLAARAHHGQIRKYTEEPYIGHPERVAAMVRAAGADEDIICAALLHDVVEDCGVPLHTIDQLLGNTVMNLVFKLTTTKIPGENRAARKDRERQRLADAAWAVQTIKLADIIDNMPSIIEHDPEFAKVYMHEKRELLPLLTNGDQNLHDQAKAIVHSYFEREGKGGTGNA